MRIFELITIFSLREMDFLMKFEEGNTQLLFYGGNIFQHWFGALWKIWKLIWGWKLFFKFPDIQDQPECRSQIVFRAPLGHGKLKVMSASPANRHGLAGASQIFNLPSPIFNLPSPIFNLPISIFNLLTQFRGR